MVNPVNSSQWAILAGVRFILASIVLMSHLGASLGHGFVSNFFDGFNASAAVVGFFIISGFSIANSITTRPERYMLRRFWRIWPTFLTVYLLLTVPLAILNGSASAAQIVGGTFFLNGLLVPSLLVNNPLWTLAIEEWLYLFAPAFSRASSMLLSILVVVSAIGYWNAYRLGWCGFSNGMWGSSYFCFAWAWLGGFLFYRHVAREWTALLLIGIPMLLVSHLGVLEWRYPTATLLMPTLAIAYGSRMQLGNVARHVLSELGNWSFPLYVIHYPIFFLFTHYIGGPAILKVAMAGMLSWAVYRYVDSPLRGRWKPKKNVIKNDAGWSTIQRTREVTYA